MYRWRKVGVLASVLASFGSATVPSCAVAQVQTRFVRFGQGTSGIADGQYGVSMLVRGDLDGDGTVEVAVGAPDTDGKGTVWIWSLNRQGTVVNQERLDVSVSLKPLDDPEFGSSVASMGDIDGDGVDELVVGGPLYDDRFDLSAVPNEGAVWLFLSNQVAPVLIERGDATLPERLPDCGAPQLDEESSFGAALASPGDIDGDGIPDLVVGAPNGCITDSVSPQGSGAYHVRSGVVYVLFLNSDGSIREYSTIDAGVGGVGEAAQDASYGAAISLVSDLDGDGVREIAIGAPGFRSLGSEERTGAVFIVRLNAQGIAESFFQLPPPGVEEATGGQLRDGDRFGASVSLLGDVDGDGNPELLVGAPGDDDGNRAVADADRGAVYRYFLDQVFRVKSVQKISDQRDGLLGRLGDGFLLGTAVGSLGDLDGDGFEDMMLGAGGDGAFYTLFSLPLPLQSLSNLDLSTNLPSRGEEVVVTGHWGTGVSEAVLSFRRAGERDSFQVNMSTDGLGLYSGTISAFVVDEQGVQYNFVITERTKSVVRIPPEGFLSIPVKLPDGLTVPLTTGGGQSGYRLYSIPLDLDQANVWPRLVSALGSADVEQWRAYGQQLDLSIAEMTPSGFEIRPGQAWWLVTKRPTEGVATGPGVTIATDEPYAVPLGPGWNLVGHPFNFETPATALRLAGGGARPGALSFTGDWEESERLRPFQGYAVFSATLDTLLMSADSASASSKWGRVDRPIWSVSVSASDGVRSDALNSASVFETARVGPDEYDRPEPPWPEKGLTVYFPHEDWPLPIHRFRTDSRPPSDSGHEWSLALQSETPAAVTVRFELQGAVPLDFDAVLLDDDLGVSQRLSEASVYRVRVGPQERRLRLIVGTDAFLADRAERMPEGLWEVGLDVFPNPSSGVATVAVDHPSTGPLSLAVYDILGRRVVTLADDGYAESGRHVYVWDASAPSGASLAGGLYILRLVSGQSVETASVLLVNK